jgi:hypothetical protein
MCYIRVEQCWLKPSPLKPVHVPRLAIDRVAPRFKRDLRPILQGVEFAAPSTDDPLIEAVHFLKAAFPKGKPLGDYAETVIPTPNWKNSLRAVSLRSTVESPPVRMSTLSS